MQYLTASDSIRWANCTGSPLLCTESTSPEFESDAQKKGQEIHKAVIEENPEYENLVRPYRELVTESESHGFETKTRIPWLPSSLRVDAWKIHDNRLYVYELKTGYTPVPVENHWPLVLYAISLNFHGPCTLVIYQPYDFESPIKQWNLEYNDLTRIEAWLYARFQIASAGKGTLQTGDWCRHCPQRIACPALKNTVATLIDYASEYRVSVPSPYEIGKELEFLEIAKQRIKSRISALSQLAEHRISHGVPIPGWEVSPTRSNRAWINPEQAAEIIRYRGVIPTKERIISPAQAENEGLDPKLVNELSTTCQTGVKLRPLRKLSI